MIDDLNISLQNLQLFKSSFLNFSAAWDETTTNQRLILLTTEFYGISSSNKLLVGLYSRALKTVAEKYNLQEFDLTKYSYANILEVINLTEKYLDNKAFL